jgi:hypothetical protein
MRQRLLGGGSCCHGKTSTDGEVTKGAEVLVLIEGTIEIIDTRASREGENTRG